MIKEKDLKKLKLKGIVDSNGILSIDTSKWMRPTTACNIDSLEGLTLVNIETAPDEVKRYIK